MELAAKPDASLGISVRSVSFCHGRKPIPFQVDGETYPLIIVAIHCRLFPANTSTITHFS